ncbi:site-specific integrase [Cupriavidus neocaledonicus]|uniref:Shufflon-specific recombinase n=1 Tax=Cupriavidus neocaledonicus TaxID=1040979 RepID=A0A375HAY5_9BURK|nr:site-specific integrase [Cupriavidus neocaledonicus]SPD48445.1 Shufflon-specific recombinase [Cupriavidus neocaledonicus]
MASFRKRGELQWQARISRKGFPPQVKTFNTKADAEAWARQIESEIDRGVFVSRAAAENTTLSEVLTRYEREILPSKKGASPEISVLRIWQATEISTRVMAAVRSVDVAKLRDEWLVNRKPATVLRRLAVLSHVFSIARKEWGMESLTNPVDLVRKPQPNNARTRRITSGDSAPDVSSADEEGSSRGARDGELERVMAASGSALLPSIICLAVETAMRRGEIVSLRWENVDLKRRIAHLPTTKNGSSRDVPLSTRAIAVLQARKDAEASSGDDVTEDSAADAGQIFRIRGDAVTRAFERAVLRARKLYEDECKLADRARPDGKFLTDLRFHDLRHEATSRLASIFPMHELAKITGHKDPRMLMRYYHPNAEELAKRLS